MCHSRLLRATCTCYRCAARKIPPRLRLALGGFCGVSYFDYRPERSRSLQIYLSRSPELRQEVEQRSQQALVAGLEIIRDTAVSQDPAREVQGDGVTSVGEARDPAPQICV